MSNKIPIVINMYPIISLIETSALQKLGQRDRSYKAQQRPGQSNIKIDQSVVLDEDSVPEATHIGLISDVNK